MDWALNSSNSWPPWVEVPLRPRLAQWLLCTRPLRLWRRPSQPAKPSLPALGSQAHTPSKVDSSHRVEKMLWVIQRPNGPNAPHWEMSPSKLQTNLFGVPVALLAFKCGEDGFVSMGRISRCLRHPQTTSTILSPWGVNHSHMVACALCIASKIQPSHCLWSKVFTSRCGTPMQMRRWWPKCPNILMRGTTPLILFLHMPRAVQLPGSMLMCSISLSWTLCVGKDVRLPGSFFWSVMCTRQRGKPLHQPHSSWANVSCLACSASTTQTTALWTSMCLTRKLLKHFPTSRFKPARVSTWFSTYKVFIWTTNSGEDRTWFSPTLRWFQLNGRSGRVTWAMKGCEPFLHLTVVAPRARCWGWTGMLGRRVTQKGERTRSAWIETNGFPFSPWSSKMIKTAIILFRFGCMVLPVLRPGTWYSTSAELV